MPWDFRALPPEHRAELTALTMIEGELENYYHSESRRLNSKNDGGPKIGAKA
jgi:hypothetical protein